MDADEKKHEAKVELDLGFDHIFENDDQPASFRDFLEAFGDAMGDASKWIEEKYGSRAADAWSRIVDAVHDTRGNVG